MEIKYAVIGTGAIGGYYGAKLAQHNKDVHFLLYSDYDHVKNNGLTIESCDGNFELKNPNIYNDIRQMPKCDVILVALKTTQNEVLKDYLPHITHSKSIVIMIQNGLGVERDLANWLPDLQVCGALAFIAATKIGKGLIKHIDLGRIMIGAYNFERNELLQQVTADFNESGIPAKLSDDLQRARWEKLVWNIAFNGPTVVLNALTDRLMKNELSRKMVYDLMLEVIKGAQATGVAIEETYADKMMAMTDKMKPYAPSMKVDFDHKRAMEVRYIYTVPIEVAKASGYHMKKVEQIEEQLRFIAER